MPSLCPIRGRCLPADDIPETEEVIHSNSEGESESLFLEDVEEAEVEEAAVDSVSAVEEDSDG